LDIRYYSVGDCAKSQRNYYFNNAIDYVCHCGWVAFFCMTEHFKLDVFFRKLNLQAYAELLSYLVVKSNNLHINIILCVLRLHSKTIIRVVAEGYANI